MVGEPLSVIDAAGEVVGAAPDIPDADVARLYRAMLQLRLLDERMLRLQRQGRIGFYMTSTGEEAEQLGSAYPLRPSDWVFPSYREPGTLLWRGYTLKDFLCQLMGNAESPDRGRQMPVHHTAKALNYVSISSPVGTQIPQAVGAALAARHRGRDDVALVYFGDGATSTGSFHVGLNFAGALRAPAVFFCRNNGFAISVPTSRQTAARTIAQKALAYGMPGVLVDGNDLLAVVQVTTQAVERARRGGGPTLIEARTYRMGAHSSSDDPSVYRDPAEAARWQRLDPLERLRRYLGARGRWDAAQEERWRQEITAAIGAALAAAEAVGPPPLGSIFEDVYAELPAHLAAQRREAEAGRVATR
ncbi:MAG TPA: thiamine pyrophosphate-dependent dehydrogenase E1 component subunit alpha [Polyangia bacterium]